MKLHYVTSNHVKFQEAKLIFTQPKEPQVHLIHTPIQLEEIQGTAQEIIHHKALEAYNKIHEPVIVDDVSVSLDALGGLPGPYIRAFLEALGEDGLWDLARRYENRRIHATCYIGYCHIATKRCGGTHNDIIPRVFSHTVHGTIVSPRGKTRHGPQSWNSIIIPDGLETTIAEMSLEEISRISPRNGALSSLKKYLVSHLEAT